MRPANDDSFEEWVARVRPGLVRAADRLLRDRDEAENVVQATLLAVWEASRVGATEDLERYARRAVHLNALRQRARRREHVPIDEAGHVEAAAELGSGELERAILGLPPAQQAVLRLRFYAGMSFKEIGHSLAISMNTAASRCRYALRALRGALDPDQSGGEDP